MNGAQSFSADFVVSSSQAKKIFPFASVLLTDFVGRVLPSSVCIAEHYAATTFVFLPVKHGCCGRGLVVCVGSDIFCVGGGVCLTISVVGWGFKRVFAVFTAADNIPLKNDAPPDDGRAAPR